MKFASARSAWMRFVAIAVICTAVLVTLVPAQSTLADAPNKGENIVVTSTGQEYPALQADTTVSQSFAGTGEITAFSERAMPLRAGSVIPERTESVIGPDGRKQVGNPGKFPNRAIASIVFTQGGVEYVCTAWFIGPHTLATAGHCVYDPLFDEWSTNVVVYPGRNGNSAPYGSANGVELFTNKCWQDSAGYGNPKCDYGAIKIDSDLGNTVGWFGYSWSQGNSFLLNRKVHVRGYPGDKSPYGYQWTMKGPIQHATNKMIGYSIDTFGGQSGSPVFKKFQGCGQCAFGIHGYGVGVHPFGNKNSGVRINQKVFNNLNTWKSQ